jgi:hypothetical protein
MSEEKKRPMSEARKKANSKYNASAYDRIEVKLPKGKKDAIKEHAEQFQSEVGEIGKAGHTPKGSVTGFISRAIDETMERDKNAKAVNKTEYYRHTK